MLCLIQSYCGPLLCSVLPCTYSHIPCIRSSKYEVSHIRLLIQRNKHSSCFLSDFLQTQLSVCHLQCALHQQHSHRQKNWEEQHLFEPKCIYFGSITMGNYIPGKTELNSRPNLATGVRGSKSDEHRINYNDALMHTVLIMLSHWNAIHKNMHLNNVIHCASGPHKLTSFPFWNQL